jgi:hypothetical protein
MVKKKILVEIEYPEGFDLCWDHSDSGHQAFNDTIVCQSLIGARKSLVTAIEKCKENNLTTEKEFENDDYYNFITTKIEVSNSLKVIGFINTDNQLEMLSDN